MAKILLRQVAGKDKKRDPANAGSPNQTTKMLHAGKKLFLMFSDIIEQDIRAFLDFLKR